MRDKKPYIACCPDMEFRILDYFLLLSEGPYEEKFSKDEELYETIMSRKWVKKISDHIKTCSVCHEGYEYLKRVFENGKELSEKDGFFSLNELKMIERNEKFLEEII